MRLELPCIIRESTGSNTRIRMLTHGGSVSLLRLFSDVKELSIGRAPFSCVIYPPTTRSHVLTPSAWGPDVVWQQSNAHRSVSVQWLAWTPT